MRFTVRQRPLLACAALAACVALAPVSAQQAPEKVDHDAIYKIKEEGFQRSRVMETMSWLTDVYGPRLTNSPGYRKAGDWAVKELTSWGLSNARLEPFPFGRGWANEKFSMTATTPGGSFPVIGMSQGWTPGTDGPVSADAVFAVLDTDDDLARFKGKLRGKVVLLQNLREVSALWTPPATRYNQQQLDDLQRETDSIPRRGRGRFGARANGPGRQGGRGDGPQTFAQRRMQFLKDEGALAMVSAGTRGDGGTVFVQGGGSREPNAPATLPSIVISVEHYGRMARTLQKGLPVRTDLDIRDTFFD
ncbi:MAG: hypothetical protein ACRD15_19125, partial [Vicinamibacterales bacterium]